MPRNFECLIYEMLLIKEKRLTLNTQPIPFQQKFTLHYFILLFFKFHVVFHIIVSYIVS